MVLIAFVVKLHYFCTDGFRVDKLYCSHGKTIGDDGGSIVSFLPGGLINGKFCYIGKGRQAYVFASDTHVIKFLRYHKYKRPLWVSVFNFFNFRPHWLEQNLREQEERERRAIISYNVAFQHLKDETCIEFIHLNRTDNLKRRLKIFDKCGRELSVDLDSVAFIIQRRALPLPSIFIELRKRGDLKGLKNLILSYLKMGYNCSSKGVANRDFKNYVRNCGYYNNRVIQIDVGSFYVEDSLHKKELIKREMSNFVDPLKVFLKEEAPEMITFVEENGLVY